jgi:hypothetical protein
MPAAKIVQIFISKEVFFDFDLKFFLLDMASIPHYLKKQVIFQQTIY